MNVEIKKAVKSGNSSAVILPRAWLSREVRIELIERTPESVLLDVLNLIKENVSLLDIIGVYLAGSYARGEETKDSDIDILVVTKHINHSEIHKGIYNILIMSEEAIKQKLKKDLLPVGQMLKEAKPLINSAYLSSIIFNVNQANTIWQIKRTEEKISLIEKSLKDYKESEKVDNQIVYTLILRLRTLYIIEQLLKNRAYSGREFISAIKKVSGSDNAYKSYLYEKNSEEKLNLTLKQEAGKLLEYLKKQLKEVKRKVK